MSSSDERLGVGIEYRPELRDSIFESLDRIDFVEILTETCFHPRGLETAKELAGVFPVVCHGLDLSIGTDEPLCEDYVKSLRKALAVVKPRWVSDHLAMSRVGDVEIGHLAPLMFSEEVVEIVCRRLAELKRRFDLSILLENITYYFQIPGRAMKESEFIRRILEQADCGLLLDVNNLFVNAMNHGYDPYDFLNDLPIERVVEVHIGGCEFRDGLYVDTHGHAVRREVWQLLEWLCSHVRVRGIVLERDQNQPPLEELLRELDIARSIYARSSA